MTERLFQRDSYLKTFDARVTAVRPEGVRLDRTAFFPTGGGVLGDTRTLTGPSGLSRVVETMEDEGGVLHRLRRARPPLGEAVHGGAGWGPPYPLIRSPTAPHAPPRAVF